MKKRWLGILLALCLLVCFAPAALAAEGDVLASGTLTQVYVRADGNDETGEGTQEKPVASLAKAVDLASKDTDATIYVMSDLEMTQSARYWSGNITITSCDSEGAPFTISRAKTGFKPVSDLTQGGYNGAMIEVGNSGNLTLSNIILDDGGYAAYTENHEEGTIEKTPYFSQVNASGPSGGHTEIDGEKVSNFFIAQDGIITTYSENTTITLKNGTVLRNYGGMSAVRVSGGTLIMENGSKITDTLGITRTKGKGGTGPAGAVWVQSGKVEMQEGSSIENLNGRAIYADGAGSDVTVDGTISGITVNDKMWNGKQGVAIHLRNHSAGNLSANGIIKNISGSGSNAVFIHSYASFEMVKNSAIKNVKGVGVQLYGDVGGTLYMDGEITKCTDSAIHMNADLSKGNTVPEAGSDRVLKATIGPNGDIHGNTGGYGNVTMQTYNGTLDVYGKIHDNISADNVGIVMAGNHSGTTVTLHSGSAVTGNITKGNCYAGVWAVKGTFIMEEGSAVSNNIAVGSGENPSGYAGVAVTSGNTFVMNGGTISGNISVSDTSGVILRTQKGTSLNDKDAVFEGKAVLHDGTITGNIRNAVITSTDEGKYTWTGGTPTGVTIDSTGTANIERYLTIDDTVTIDEPSVYMRDGKYCIERPAEGVKLGNSSENGEEALKEASAAKGWSKTLLASFWAQADNNQTWVLSGLTKTSDNLPVYALMMPTNAEGNVGTNTEATVYAVTVNADGTWSFTVPDGNTTGYVVGLVQPTKDYGTLTLVANPATLTEDVGGTVNYTATYKPADNLINQLGGSESFTLTITLARGMTYVKDSFTGPTDASVSGNTITITGIKKQQLEAGFTAKFSATALDTIKAGDTFVTNAVLEGNITVQDSKTTVTLVATATVTVTPKPEDPIEPTDPPYIPPVDPDEPADPDDTGVSDLLNTEDHIQYLFGYPDGTFGPENNMTRAEVAQMFYNLLLDQDVEIAKTFDDVPANAWYAKAVNTLASLDIISGVGDNKFEPERSITRAEFTAMAMKFAVGGEEGENIFSDVDEDDWFYDAVVNSIQYGWIHGYGDGTFRPNNPITRAEVTAIVNNMLGRAADEDFVDEHAEELTQFSDIEKHWAYYHIVEATNDHDYTKPSSGENWTKLN